jgi:hypothetical protein
MVCSPMTLDIYWSNNVDDDGSLIRVLSTG